MNRGELMCDNPIQAADNRQRIAAARKQEAALPELSAGHKPVCVYTDGSTTDICFVVTNGGQPTATIRKPAQPNASVTSNEGEYWAIIHALSYLSAHDIWAATLMADSLLVVSQICGLYKVKEPRLAHLLEVVRAQLIGMDVDFQWVPRGENLAGIVLEEKKVVVDGNVRADGTVRARKRV